MSWRCLSAIRQQGLGSVRAQLCHCWGLSSSIQQVVNWQVLRVLFVMALGNLSDTSSHYLWQLTLKIKNLVAFDSKVFLFCFVLFPPTPQKPKQSAFLHGTLRDCWTIGSISCSATQIITNLSNQWLSTKYIDTDSISVDIEWNNSAWKHQQGSNLLKRHGSLLMTVSNEQSCFSTPASPPARSFLPFYWIALAGPGWEAAMHTHKPAQKVPGQGAECSKQ